MSPTNTHQPFSSRSLSRGRQADGSPNKVDIYLGSRIRLCRQMLKLSQEQVGKMLGLTFQQIQKYEKGQNRISASRLYDFACIFGVDVNFFYQDMPADVCSQSPRFIQSSAEFTSQQSDTFTHQSNPMYSTKMQQLVNNFLHLSNPVVADKLFDLIEIMRMSSYYLRKHKPK